MKNIILIFCLTVSANGQTIVWNQNTEDDLAGYNLYYGAQSRDYSRVINAGLNTELFLGYPFNTTYVAVTAYDESGNESRYSAEVSYPKPVKQDTLIVKDHTADRDFRIVIIYKSKGGGFPAIDVQWQKYNPDKTIYSSWIDMPAQGDTTWNWRVNSSGDTLTFNGTQIASERFNPGLYFLQQYRIRVNDSAWSESVLMRLIRAWVPERIEIIFE